MVDKKTSAETLRPVLDDTEMFRGALGDGTDNFRTTASAIAEMLPTEKQVPQLDDNPAVDSRYLGVDPGDTELAFKQIRFGFGSVFMQDFDAVNEGANGTADLGNYTGKTARVFTDEGGHPTAIIMPFNSVVNEEDGIQFYVQVNLTVPEDTAIIDLAHVLTVDGNSFTTITFTDSGQYVLFEFRAGSWRPLRGTAIFDPPLSSGRVPALDPNPAVQASYLGAVQGDEAFYEYHPSYGFVDCLIELTGVSGEIHVNIEEGKSSRFINLITDGLGGVNALILPNPSDGTKVGVRQTFVLETLTDPGDTVVVDLTYLKNLDGSSLTSVIFSSIQQSLLVEHWDDGYWRVLRGTAVIDPPIGVKVTNGVPVTSSNIVDFTATFGAIDALTGTIETVTIVGLLTTDHVTVSCIDSPPSGMIIANARVSAADTLEIYIVTAVAIGITLGALNFRCLVHR